MTPPDAVLLDDESLVAWPCLSEMRLGDWLLRFGGNVYGRSNSVQPFGDPGCPLEEAVDRCEAVYDEARIRPMFRVPGGRDLVALDRLLPERGYEVSDPSFVMIRPLDGGQLAGTASLTTDPDLDWLGAYREASGRGSGREAAVEAILRRTPQPRRFASIERDGEIASVGLGVVVAGTLWIFSIGTKTAHRGNRLAEDVTSSLMAWGRGEGANRVALQVADTNEAARRLYKRLGFTPAYRYHYWRK